ncbi:MAG: hypothetical protein J1E60_04460, partial [Christensenellaceae bacterium]|nr:hypothetical protein [Christensenellaceae bacterium]
MKAKKLSVLLVLAALGLAALLIVSCVPTQQGDIQKKSPSPSADMTTEKQAAEITKTPNITPEVTAAP